MTRYTSNSSGWNCSNWTALAYTSGSSVYATWGLTVTAAGYVAGRCDQARQIACCE